MDTGKSRTAADVLSINGYTSSAQLAAIVTGIIRKERWGLRAATYRGASAYQITAKQVLSRLEAEPSLAHLVQIASKMKKAGLSGKVAGILYYVFSGIDQEDTDFFFEKLETGEGLHRGNPILVLRETLTRLRASTKGQADTGYTAALTIKAWNKFRAGEDVTMLRFTPGGSTPERFPEPI